MRITIVYRYFWPDTAPYALLLRELLPHLVSAGHQVRILAAQPSYASDARAISAPRRSNEFGCDVVRIRLLPRSWPFAHVLNAFLFPVAAALRILFGERTDVVWSGTTPPIIQSLLVFAASRFRRARTIYQMQDIYPEIAIAAGMMRNGFVSRLLKHLDRLALRLADRVVVLSHDMAAAIRTRCRSEPEVINNFAVGAYAAAGPERSDNERTRFVFAGNIGRFQNLENLLSAFLLVDEGEAELHFLGDGKAKPGLMRQADDRIGRNVFFHGRVSSDNAFRFTRDCDVGVISLQPGLYRLAYPSKTGTYLAAGVKILACVEEESELAQTLRGRGLGVAVGWNEGIAGIAGAMKRVSLLAPYDPRNCRDLWSVEDASRKWLALLHGMDVKR